MSTINQLPSPLFDGLQDMIDNEGFQPKLAKQFDLDYKHARRFLLSYRGSKDTFNAYHRDIERFLLWCQLKANKGQKPA